MHTDFLTATLGTFQAVLSLGMYRTGSVMASVFWALTVIELTSFGAWWLYSHDTNAGAVVLRLVALMVFAWMIQNWQTIAGSLQDMFIKLGIGLGSNKLALPTVNGAGMALIDKGFELFLSIQGLAMNPTLAQRITEAIDALTPSQAAWEKWFMAWCAYAAFIIAGVSMFVVQIQFALYSAIAFVTIPFAAWGRTAWITEKTFGSVMACGLVITFFYALAGIQLTVFEHYAMPVVQTQRSSLSIIISGWLLVALMAAAHKLARGILQGTPSLTQSDVLPRLSTALAISSRGMRAAATAMRQLSRRRS